MARRILAFGHSHLGALQAAHERAGPRPTPAADWRFKQLWGRYDPFVRASEGEPRYNEALEADMLGFAAEAGADAVFLSTLIGSEHFLWSVQGQCRPFDIILPFADALPRVPDVPVIPFALAHRFAHHTISAILRFNGRLQSLTGRPVHQLLPPPPVADPDRVLADAPGPIREEMAAAGVPHRAVRYKLWRLWVHVARGIAERDGVAVCAGPAGTTDGDGLLLDRFCADAVHANAAYGLLAMRCIEDATA